MAKKLAGIVTHYYPKISVAVVDVKDNLRIGDRISIVRGTDNLQQKVASMQIDYKPITEAKKGQIIGLKVNGEVKEGAEIFKEVVASKNVTKKSKKATRTAKKANPKKAKKKKSKKR